jgi:subtilisin-like proprotein convertase family protein
MAETITIDPAMPGLDGDGGRTKALRSFINRTPDLFGGSFVEGFEDAYDYANPSGGLGFAGLIQKVNGIPVFQGEIKAAFNKRNELVRVVNNLAPVRTTPAADFGTPERALAMSVVHVGVDAGAATPVKAEKDGKYQYERGQFADEPSSEKVYFPIEPGTLVPAWKTLIWLDSQAYYVIVDARSGTLLWRKNITESQLQTLPATYNVYGSGGGMLNAADSPTPFTPGCITPLACPQPPVITRTSFTLVGNEAPHQFNNFGWIPDAGLPVRTPADNNITDGNNLEAGVDRDGINGVDPNGWGIGNPNRVFSFDYNPAPGNPPPGDDPLGTAFQRGASTHAFYIGNRFHDAAYRLGFTEAAGNFQHFNFGRGGSEGDRVSLEIQDSSGTNNSNFSTPADGGRPRLQAYLFTPPVPARDGALDSQVMVHELTHGVSARLHGNTTGLSSNMARGLGEGWSDFFAFAMLSDPTDDRLGLYPYAGYVSNDGSASPQNYYYGVRRFPTAVWAATGQGGCRHNPLTFADIDSTQYSVSDACFPRATSSIPVDHVFYLGELWNVVLWEVRDKLVEAHGPVEGNRRALQYVMDGMKLSPLNPTMVQSRDAIIVAAQASDAADVARLWAGFAVRGLGFGAVVVNAGTGNNNTRVTESYGTPNVALTEPFSVSDSVGNNNGYPEMGENLLITVTLTNTTGAAISNVAAGIRYGGTASFGTIASGQTVSRQITYFLAPYGTCDNRHTININVSSSAGSFSVTRQFRFGPPAPVFANPAPIAINDNGPAATYPSVIAVAGVNGNPRVSVELTGFTHTFPSDVDVMLQSPGGRNFILMSDAGGSASISTPINLTLSDLAAAQLPESSRPAGGEYRPTNYGAGDPFPSPAPQTGVNSPGPAGSATFDSAFSGTQANGDWKLYVVDDSGNDTGSFAGGWKLTLDSPLCIDIFPDFRNSPDFDGDRRTDISVFRPSNSVWYLNRSTAGFGAVQWGISTDFPAPADYDGDLKTDIAVFRPTADGSQADFYIIKSSDSTFSYVSWGIPGDEPAVADFDGDARADVAVFRPSTRTFWVLKSSGSGVLNSPPMSSERALIGDFDGDARGDFASFANGQWYVLRSSLSYQTPATFQWGLDSDKLAAADYDGDGRDDAAVYRPSDGTWYILRSSGGADYVRFGIASDEPVPGDYDGDGKSDVAVYRSGTWYVNQSSAGFFATQFGLAGDKPLPGTSVH